MRPLISDTVDARAAAPAPWLSDLRVRGLEAFQQLPMPTSDEEEWRYVDLDFDLDDLGLADEPGESLPDSVYAVDGVGSAQIIDGSITHITAADGISILPASEADVAALTGAAASALPVDLDRFSAAHHAFGGDGLVIHAPRGVAAAGPVFVDVQAVTPGTLSLPRIMLVADPQSDLSVIVVYRSPDGEVFHVIPQLQATVGDAARLRLTTIQAWGYQTTAIGQQRVVLGRDANLHHGEVGIGASLGRLHFFVDIDGAGAHSEITGLYFGEDDQVLDYRAFINHRAPNTTSNMFLKGAVEDESHSVFTGLIRIEEEAQRVNAFQTNRNLVLSDQAGAESVPNLEILANDVKCGHGSTVGPLDADQRYYLMSRGLDRIHSDRLQVRGFFEEALGQLPHPELAAPIRTAVNEKYIRAQEEGRL
ncbi:MAG: Fe-S cluster assembly protein SufD [Acidimicrobiia bacterium]|nr:Fe-S cluster assembly protein SufD [Acidimicrobiia bacterium]NNL99073.1 Fe-S cluster assembly protein SufD [Acidimicrobiia bacterium]